jgi:hypothetical protein
MNLFEIMKRLRLEEPVPHQQKNTNEDAITAFPLVLLLQTPLIMMINADPVTQTQPNARTMGLLVMDISRRCVDECSYEYHCKKKNGGTGSQLPYRFRSN